MTAVRSRSLQRLLAILVIALGACALSGLLAVMPGTREAVRAMDWAAYDAVYRLREPASRDGVPVTLIEIDARSLEEFDAHRVGWPWPRGESGWADVIRYLELRGARAVVFDLLFNQRSALGPDDDEEFARAIDEAKVPLIFASTRSDAVEPVVGPKPGTEFAPPVIRPPILAKVDVSAEASSKVYRIYEGVHAGVRPTLARAAIEAAGLRPARAFEHDFALRYHGPHRWNDGQTSTYRTVRASAVVLAAMGALDADSIAPGDDLFRDRIVLIGATAAALHDLKSTPIEARYPGTSVHATAIDNLLSGDEVRIAPLRVLLAVALIGALLVAMATVAGRSWWIKLATAGLMLITLGVASTQLMLAPQMRWLPPTAPMAAVVLSSVGGLVWSYRLEDARARMLLKAVARCVSPAVADTLAADPRALAVGGQQREMTVMFTDMQGFTDLTESLREKIEPLLNFYLGQLSEEALARDGTIDKFIGDAMMVFWNAPLSQPNHALQACRTALGIIQREKQITPRLLELGARRPMTRVGIHTGPMVVGFFGSQQRLSYTAIGDAVNLAARLEPANKLYGTQTLLSQTTADVVREHLLVRPVDRLCVYGKQESCELFTLVGEKSTATEQDRWLCEITAEAIRAYRLREWMASRKLWVEILARIPDDGLARTYVERIDRFEITPPPPDWDGTFVAAAK